LVAAVLSCCSCAGPEKKIVGYWMRGDGYTISFMDEECCSFGEGEVVPYRIYDKDHLQVEWEDRTGVTEFVFKLEGDELQIGVAGSDGYEIFTKNADEQKAILESVRQLEAEEAEYQKTEEKRQELLSQIDDCYLKIAALEKDIAFNESAIENNRKDIVKWEEAIAEEQAEYEEKVNAGEDPVYHGNMRDDFVKSYEESIEGCKDRIAELEAKNIELGEEIEGIRQEIEILEQKLDELD